MAFFQYVFAILLVIALPSFLSKVFNAKQVEAKQFASSMNRAQQAYFLENEKFTDSFSELGLGIKTQIEKYNYSIRTTPLTVFNYGVSRNNNLRNYVGGVFLNSSDEATGEIVTIEIMCESKSPTISRPAEPVVRGDVLECDPSTKSLSGREPIVLGKDAALAYNSLNYAAKGQYDQALEVTKTITDDSFKEMALKAIAHSRTHPRQ